RALSELVRDGFVILKVGPALTFALREALYGLDQIGLQLGLITPDQAVSAVMERTMLDQPSFCEKYYPGTPAQQYLQRHFSLSDRIRYYWPHADAAAAIERLMTALGAEDIPVPLIGQYLGGSRAATFDYAGPRDARTLLILA